MSSSQVGIERLPARSMSNEPRESMNCKSCRKRKIKCNRIRPACKACQVFGCSCIYDAVPKKRGPKTDVLEALLKRVDGLEKRLQEETKSDGPGVGASGTANVSPKSEDVVSQPRVQHGLPAESFPLQANPKQSEDPNTSSDISPDDLFDSYFSHLHGKPLYILDERVVRQGHQTKQLPSCLAMAIYALGARYAMHPGGYSAAERLSRDYALRARSELDLDDPTIDNLQTALLLSLTFFAIGLCKKAYMVFATAAGMAIALELHREVSPKAAMNPTERELRRNLFWACYTMDRFLACGSKRPSLLADESITLRLPTWTPHPTARPVEGEVFSNGSNLQYYSASGRKGQGATGMLIDIVRILGITNRYLAAGGVKGDSHFPWHSLSNLSKIRQDLDLWASGTQDMFSSVEALFGQGQSTVLVFSKLIYHLIHCLIYRPFLPIDLAELSGTGEHQSWQIEATNLCFLHANAIAELVELGRSSPTVEWPSFVGYCIFTAATVHVHGACYRGVSSEVFTSSSEFLGREMNLLSELGCLWRGVRHQGTTLQKIYDCHSHMVKTLASNSMRFSPIFHLEDFFERYPGQVICASHLELRDVQDGDGQLDGSGPYAAVGVVGAPLQQQQQQIGGPLSFDPSIIGIQAGPSQPNSMQPPTTQVRNDDDSNSNSNGPFQLDQAYSSNEMAPPQPFSPSFDFSLPSGSAEPQGSFDPIFGISTPSATSALTFGQPSNSSTSTQAQASSANTTSPNATTTSTSNTDTDLDGTGTGDPFLSLLEQLAENEYSQGEGPSELDFFLGGQE
ncbi:MAG: hypothetical protein M1819_005075 [Sarea resinae]|nr:MAG: hypothetical protein M1819_005075 [Sarea resinae]